MRVQYGQLGSCGCGKTGIKRRRCVGELLTLLPPATTFSLPDLSCHFLKTVRLPRLRVSDRQTEHKHQHTTDQGSIQSLNFTTKVLSTLSAQPYNDISCRTPVKMVLHGSAQNTATYKTPTALGQSTSLSTSCWGRQ